jgi:hypothetical protein
VRPTVEIHRRKRRHRSNELKSRDKRETENLLVTAIGMIINKSMYKNYTAKTSDDKGKKQEARTKTNLEIAQRARK